MAIRHSLRLSLRTCRVLPPISGKETSKQKVLKWLVKEKGLFMSDIADIADIEIENALNQQISNFRQKINRVGSSSPVCAICGEIIPPARQKAVPGCRLCLDCQEEREKNANR